MPLSLYLHIPFCQVRCAYCDFNTYAGLQGLMPAYARALAKEVRLTPLSWPSGPGEGGEVHTVYFGGGTPSLMPLPLLMDVFAALRESFCVQPDCEITLEANPGTVDGEYLEGLRDLGVNRLSYGVQSAHPSELRLLDRLHTFEQGEVAVALARAAGFVNLNLDLIFGLPNQTLELWQDSLEKTLALRPEHLSLYALSLEHGTPLRAWVYRGLLPMPDPDLAADMYEWACERLGRARYIHYEISNWAKDGRTLKSQIRDPKSEVENPGFACRHNLQYWRNEEYLGLGAGAHGYFGGRRYWNVLAPGAYIERMGAADMGSRRVRERGRGGEPRRSSPVVAESAPVDRDSEMAETMLMGLRLLREGVEAYRFRQRFGQTLGETYGQELRELEDLGLIELDNERVRLSRRGWLLGTQVFQRFV